jgi:hypothetical protein
MLIFPGMIQSTALKTGIRYILLYEGQAAESLFLFVTDELVGELQYKNWM